MDSSALPSYHCSVCGCQYRVINGPVACPRCDANEELRRKIERVEVLRRQESKDGRSESAATV